MFTDRPLSATTLLARLARYRFFERAELPLGVARNALHAAKLVQIAQRASPADAAGAAGAPELVARKTPTLLRVLEEPRAEDLVHEVCAHPGVATHFPNLWRDVLLAKPWPSLPTQIGLLRSNGAKIDAVRACVRIALARHEFVPAFALVDLVRPQLPFTGLGFLAAGVLSAAVWSSAPLVGGLLLVFWCRLAAAAAAPPSLPYVQFDSVRASLWHRATHRDQLVLANTILTAFYETGSTTTSNYHRRAGNPEAIDAPETLVELDRELRRRKMVRRGLTQMDLLYADYWSPSLHRWQNVEWREPDQDPAEMQQRH